MLLSDRSSRPKRFELLLILAAVSSAACEGPPGVGVVRASFVKNECKAGTERDLDGYEYEANYLATERFSGILQIIVQKHKVDIEETDGLLIRVSLQRLLEQGVLIFDREQIVRAIPDKPIVVRTSTAREDANVSLSLFGTCPEFPTHYASQGVLTLDKITLTADPMDTGTGERLGGTLTATLTRSNERMPVGIVESFFDFAPPRRPLTDFK
jgi:hypothetical protein